LFQQTILGPPKTQNVAQTKDSSTMANHNAKDNKKKNAANNNNNKKVEQTQKPDTLSKIVNGTDVCFYILK
jgi:hypothetical protein